MVVKNYWMLRELVESFLLRKVDAVAVAMRADVVMLDFVLP